MGMVPDRRQVLKSSDSAFTAHSLPLDRVPGAPASGSTRSPARRERE